ENLHAVLFDKNGFAMVRTGKGWKYLRHPETGQILNRGDLMTIGKKTPSGDQYYLQGADGQRYNIEDLKRNSDETADTQSNPSSSKREAVATRGITFLPSNEVQGAEGNIIQGGQTTTNEDATLNGTPSGTVGGKKSEFVLPTVIQTVVDFGLDNLQEWVERGKQEYERQNEEQNTNTR
ncbi:MAG: hypothetical protein LBH47_02665, partial [Christensenellaceae bacterium]|nr:hypothetical protein [Christensenellaceae bacterium]